MKLQTRAAIGALFFIGALAAAPAAWCKSQEQFEKEETARLNRKANAFVNSAIVRWKDHYGKNYKNRYPPLSDKQLQESGRLTYLAAEKNHEENKTYILSLCLLNWRAQMLGFGKEFIADATGYVLGESGTEFGLLWYDYQLRVAENPKLGATPKANPPVPSGPLAAK